MQKAADTIFGVTEVHIIGQQVFFVPLAQINALRRTLLCTLEQTRTKNYKRPVSITKQDNAAVYPFPILDYLANVMNEKAKHFFEKHGAKVNEYALEKTTHFTDKIQIKY